MVEQFFRENNLEYDKVSLPEIRGWKYKVTNIMMTLTYICKYLDVFRQKTTDFVSMLVISSLWPRKWLERWMQSTTGEGLILLLFWSKLMILYFLGEPWRPSMLETDKGTWSWCSHWLERTSGMLKLYPMRIHQ